jgi:hypothetical protein
MEEKSTIKTYDDGVKDGNEECKKQMKDSECLEMFSDGYKSGFQDGYNAAREEVKEMMLTKMPPEVRKQIEDSAQPMGWLPWW